MSRTDRTFSLTSIPPDVDPSVRECFQAVAKAIDELTNQINHISFGQSFSDIIPGARAGNFNGKFVTGRVLVGATPQRFVHNLGKVPIGAMEILTIPQINEPGGAVTNVAGALVVTAMDSESITLASSANNKVFTIIVF